MKTANATLALLVGIVLIASFSTIRATILTSDVGVKWTKYSGNPLNLGVNRTVEPWVIYGGGLFKMWYTGITDAHRIYYATSSDGISWTPYGMVLDKGEPGSWEESSVRNPIVLFDGIGYKMWYSGYSFSNARIGYATSLDGISWIKYIQNPILVPGGNGGWDDENIGTFTVIEEGSSYRMLYNGVSGGVQRIGVATSSDGISWMKYSGNPVLTPESGKWDECHVYSGPLIKNESCYVTWYSGQDTSHVRIGLATSPDGLSWSKYKDNPVLDVTPGEWDSLSIYAHAIVEKDGKLLMWYWGHSEQTPTCEGIGLATLKLSVKAQIDIDPNTLNLKSKGNLVTGYVELPEGYNVADINVSTTVLNSTVPAELTPTAINDYDGDGIPDLMVKFNRTAVSGLILSEGIKYGNVTLTVAGQLNDGTMFEGSDVIRVKMPGDVNMDGKVDVKDLIAVVKAFGSSPGKPRWNPTADENEDEKIDMIDILIVARNFGKTYT
jgi:predicted GH43/DUF377 family glycosyl hydrolase